MKYPLAIVNRLLDLYGSDIGLGYDIMCGFIKTLMQSSLGAKAVGLHLQGIVPAFHGHAHNRNCQVHWHPLYMEGVGLEDFEECERTFFRSNELASVTRLASPFHRQQQIDEHFYFHDLDKHAASGSYFPCYRESDLQPKFSGNFIYQNYWQALEKIENNGESLALLAARLGTKPEDYEAYLGSEREYLQNLLVEPANVAEKAEYMDYLTKLYRLQ